jgi:hypothetical protein
VEEKGSNVQVYDEVIKVGMNERAKEILRWVFRERGEIKRLSVCFISTLRIHKYVFCTLLRG